MLIYMCNYMMIIFKFAVFISLSCVASLAVAIRFSNEMQDWYYQLSQGQELTLQVRAVIGLNGFNFILEV